MRSGDGCPDFGTRCFPGIPAVIIAGGVFDFGILVYVVELIVYRVGFGEVGGKTEAVPV